MSVAQKPWKGLAMEGAVARWYARTRRKDLAEFRAQAHKAADTLPPGSRVLELAPGPGFFAIELARLGDFHIIGLDISRTFVGIASENARKADVNVEFRVGDAAATPFESESFDFVYCSAAFKNFPDPVKVLNEIHRLLRPTGEAMIVDLYRETPQSEIDSYIHNSGRSALDRWITRWTFRHVLLKRAYNKEHFWRLVQQSEFKDFKLECSGLSIVVHLYKT